VAGADELDEGRKRPRIRLAVASVALAVGALGVTSPELRDGAMPVRDDADALGRSDGSLHRNRVKPRPAPPVPTVSAMQSAWRYARRRGGQVSLAVVDTKGRVRAFEGGRVYHSASVVKAMLLVAELRRLRFQGLPLDPGTEELLEAMITYSDNDAADAIYGRVGDPGLVAVAHSARMRDFSVAGYWGNAQVTATDLARFFSRLRGLLPRPYRKVGLGLLASVVREQRWGLPRAARGRWSVYFKGGWRATDSGELVHQAAWLKNGDRDLAVAVLTDAQPSRLHAIHTVRGIADRLVGARARPGARRAPHASASRSSPSK
jgi:beta-lactamase family protein